MTAPQKPLQGEVTKVVSFQDVIDQNPEGWAKESPEFKNSLADDFFTKRVANQPGFADEAPEVQADIRTKFNKKYNVGHVGLDDQVSDDPLSKALIPIHRAVDLGTLGIPARAWDAANFGGTNAGEMRDAELSQYATDPGMAGDLYRLSQNGIVQGVAGFGGALKSTGGMVVNAGKSGLAALATTVGANRLARPFLGNVQKAAFTIGGGGYSALTNAIAGLQGKQSAGEALASTALDIATLPLGGSRRWTNALTQAGVGGATSLASDVIHGQPLNSKKAIEEALLQAGVGGAFPEASTPKQAGNAANRRLVMMNNPMTAVLNGQVMVRRHGNTNIEALTKLGTNKSIQTVERKEGINAKETSQKRLAAYKKEFENYNSVATDPDAPMNQRVLARQNAKNIKERALKHQQAHVAAYGKQAKPGKTFKTLKPEQLPNIVKLGVKAHAKGGESKKVFKNAVKGYDPESQTRINRALEAEIKKSKERGTTEKQRRELEQEQRNEKKAGYQERQREKKRQAGEQARQEREKQRLEKKAAGEKAAKLAAEEAAVNKRLKEIEAAKKKQKKAEDAEREKNLKAIEAAKERTAVKEQNDAIAKREVELQTLRDDILARHGDQLAKERIAEKEKIEAEKKNLKQAEDAVKEAKKKLDAEEGVLKKQAGEIEAEKKKAEKLAKAPDILDAAEIERKGQALHDHALANEKGQLDAKLDYHRKAAKNDMTRYGMTKERGKAINESHQRVLDTYAKKQAQGKKKPTVVEMKAGQEANRKALAKLNEEGGRYNAGDQTAKQKPASSYTLEDIKRTQEWDRLDDETRRKAESIDAVAKNDGKGIAEYDAERSGDTHQFKYKTVSPLGFDFLGTPENPKLIMKGVNENGHDHTYYISPSDANKETGFPSYMHDFTPMDEFNGRAKRGLEGSAYHGERELNVKEILNRPLDRTAGFTHETEALMLAAEYGKDVHQVRKSIQRNLKNAGNKQKSAVDAIINESKVLDDAALENELHESGHQSVDQVHENENVTGRPCA